MNMFVGILVIMALLGGIGLFFGARGSRGRPLTRDDSGRLPDDSGRSPSDGGGRPWYDSVGSGPLDGGGPPSYDSGGSPFDGTGPPWYDPVDSPGPPSATRSAARPPTSGSRRTGVASRRWPRR